MRGQEFSFWTDVKDSLRMDWLAPVFEVVDSLGLFRELGIVPILRGFARAVDVRLQPSGDVQTRCVCAFWFEKNWWGRPNSLGGEVVKKGNRSCLIFCWSSIRRG